MRKVTITLTELTTDKSQGMQVTIEKVQIFQQIYEKYEESEYDSKKMSHFEFGVLAVMRILTGGEINK